MIYLSENQKLHLRDQLNTHRQYLMQKINWPHLWFMLSKRPQQPQRDQPQLMISYEPSHLMDPNPKQGVVLELN